MWHRLLHLESKGIFRLINIFATFLLNDTDQHVHRDTRPEVGNIICEMFFQDELSPFIFMFYIDLKEKKKCTYPSLVHINPGRLSSINTRRPVMVSYLMLKQTWVIILSEMDENWNHNIYNRISILSVSKYRQGCPARFVLTSQPWHVKQEPVKHQSWCLTWKWIFMPMTCCYCCLTCAI